MAKRGSFDMCGQDFIKIKKYIKGRGVRLHWCSMQKAFGEICSPNININKAENFRRTLLLFAAPAADLCFHWRWSSVHNPCVICLGNKKDTLIWACVWTIGVNPGWKELNKLIKIERRASPDQSCLSVPIVYDNEQVHKSGSFVKVIIVLDAGSYTPLRISSTEERDELQSLSTGICPSLQHLADTGMCGYDVTASQVNSSPAFIHGKSNI